MRSSAVIREIDRQLTRNADDVFSRGKFAPIVQQNRISATSNGISRSSSFRIIAEKLRMFINSCGARRFRALSRKLPRDAR